MPIERPWNLASSRDAAMPIHSAETNLFSWSSVVPWHACWKSTAPRPGGSACTSITRTSVSTTPSGLRPISTSPPGFFSRRLIPTRIGASPYLIVAGASRWAAAAAVSVVRWASEARYPAFLCPCRSVVPGPA
jgi:hypothetical protein